MRALRAANRVKYMEDVGEGLYCVCSSPFGPFMIRCELCLDWFHATCVPLPKISMIGHNLNNPPATPTEPTTPTANEPTTPTGGAPSSNSSSPEGGGKEVGVATELDVSTHAQTAFKIAMKVSIYIFRSL